jgi:hypothetical protein
VDRGQRWRWLDGAASSSRPLDLPVHLIKENSDDGSIDDTTAIDKKIIAIVVVGYLVK